MAATGAKKGCWLPSTSVAKIQARVAATAICATERPARTRRSRRTRAELRERSAASPSKAPLRSDSARTVGGGRRATEGPMLAGRCRELLPRAPTGPGGPWPLRGLRVGLLLRIHRLGGHLRDGAQARDPGGGGVQPR